VNPPPCPFRAQLLLAGLFLVAQLPAGPASAHPGGVDAKGCHKQAQSTQHCHPERARAGAPSRDATQPPHPGEEGVFDGPLLWVTDGDSLRMLLRGRDTEIRLADVDAPERDQPHGWKSKLELIDLVRGRHVVLVPRDVDQYGRIVARVWVGDLDVNRELVRRGAAWFYPQYAEDDSLYNVEQEARTAKRGLWALPLRDRMEPWMWRKKAREQK
jgi:micrococcal nuclease